MINTNRLDVPLVLVNGRDASIDCGNCPSACCRKDTVMELSDAEADELVRAGTDIVANEPDKRGRIGRFLGRKAQYRLLSDCGNLVMGTDGTTSCAVFEQEAPVRPVICAEFKMGGFACARVQVARIARGEDELAICADVV